jgi:tetratricopeptide (TPR) repeat protein
MYAKGEGITALSYLQETQEKFTDQLNAFDQMRMYYLYSYVHFLMANYEDCIEYSLQGYKMADSMGHDYTAEICLIHLSNANFYRGHLDEAYAFACEALRMGEKNNHKHIIAFANCALGDIFGLLNDYILASQHFRVAQLRLGFTGISLTQVDTNLHLSNLFIWHNNLQEAHELLAPVLQITEKADIKHFFTQALILAGTCDMSEGKNEMAEEKFYKASVIAKANGLKFESLWCKLQLTQLAILTGNFTFAAETLTELLNENQRFKVAGFNLYTLDMCAQIQKFTNQEIVSNIQYRFSSYINELESQTRSSPLRETFLNAKQHWQERLFTL